MNKGRGITMSYDKGLHIKHHLMNERFVNIKETLDKLINTFFFNILKLGRGIMIHQPTVNEHGYDYLPYYPVGNMVRRWYGLGVLGAKH
jgi:hypothetical protein